jgi:hypothetical protein
LAGQPDHDDITQFVDVARLLDVDVDAPADATTVYWAGPSASAPIDGETVAFDPVDQRPRPRELPIEWQQPPRRPRRWPMILLGTLVAAAAIVAAVVVGTRSERPTSDHTGGIATDTPNPKYPPQRDLTLDACRVEADGLHMNGTVRNPTPKAANYQIDAVMLDQDGASVTQGSATVANVAPNSLVAWQTVLPPVAALGSAATCKVVKVNRAAM